MVDNGVRNDLNTRSMASINHVLELLSVPPLGDDFVGYRLSEGVLANHLLIPCPPGSRYTIHCLEYAPEEGMLQERQRYVNAKYIARHHTLDETITCRSQELRALLGNHE